MIENIINNGKPNIALDISWILYKSFYVFPGDRFKTSQGIPNGYLFGLIQCIRTLTKLNYNIFICEEGKFNFRKQLSEDYKATRQPSENNTEFWRDYPKIEALMSDLDNVYIIKNNLYESDDIMYTIAKTCSSNNIDCLIHTADKDLYQALDNHISIAKKITLKNIDIITQDSDEYTSKFPVEPSKLPIYRAFKGDSSDNLEPPVKRLPKDLLLDIVDYIYDFDDLSGYKIKKPSHKKWIKQIIDNWSIFINNYKLMKLSPINLYFVDKPQKGSYKYICDKYELSQFKNFIENLST